jgi:hypothetical protein
MAVEERGGGGGRGRCGDGRRRGGGKGQRGGVPEEEEDQRCERVGVGGASGDGGRQACGWVDEADHTFGLARDGSHIRPTHRNTASTVRSSAGEVLLL